MKPIVSKRTLMRRRAISQIIGTLIMMAVVAAIGSILLINGLVGIQNFNNALTGFISGSQSSANENLVIEHVRFNSTNSGNSNCPNNPPIGSCYFTISLWFRNTGTSDVTINTIKILNMTDQSLVSYQQNVNLKVYSGNINSLKFNINPSSYGSWNVGASASNYKISVVTSNGNSFNIVATPYNT